MDSHLVLNIIQLPSYILQMTLVILVAASLPGIECIDVVQIIGLFEQLNRRIKNLGLNLCHFLKPPRTLRFSRLTKVGSAFDDFRHFLTFLVYIEKCIFTGSVTLFIIVINRWVLLLEADFAGIPRLYVTQIEQIPLVNFFRHFS